MTPLGAKENKNRRKPKKSDGNAFKENL